MREILFGQLISQFTVMVGQTALVFMCMLLIFNISCHGNLALAVFITFLQGLVGMCFGENLFFNTKFLFYSSTFVFNFSFLIAPRLQKTFRSVDSHGLR